MIYNKYGSPDLGLLPIGAYEPRWFMKPAHMNPDDTLKAFQDLKVKKAIAIHFGTFKLTDEGIDQPLIDLQKALKKYKVDPKLFTVPVFGETYSY